MTATQEPVGMLHGSDALRLVGADTEVPLVTGGADPLRQPRLRRLRPRPPTRP